MTKKILNEYDDTKRMLNVIRNMNNKSTGKNLTERRHDYSEANAMIYGRDQDYAGNEGLEHESNEQQPLNDESGVDVVNDVDVKMNSSDPRDKTLTDEQKTMLSGIIDSFREQVSQTAELNPGFTFNMDEIRLDGVIPELDLKFTYISGQNAGLYINAEMLNITDQTMQTFTKLFAFNKQITDSLELMLRQRKNN